MSQLLLRGRSRCWVPVALRQDGKWLNGGCYHNGGGGGRLAWVATVASSSRLPSTPSRPGRSSCGSPWMSKRTATTPGWARAVTTSSKTESSRFQQQRTPSRHPPRDYYHSSSASSSRGEYYKLRHHKKATQPCPFEVLGLPRHGKKKENQKAMNTKLAIVEAPSDDDTHPSHDIDNSYDEDGAVRYRAVKAAFLRIAMAHHPDTTTAETQEELDAHRDVFIAAREAFEQIVSGANGIAVLRSESPDHAADEDGGGDGGPPLDVDAWFQSQTGHSMPFMDLQTMKEVAKMTETVGHGLDRDGGMWLLAEMVSDSVKKGGSGDGASILRLEAGDASNGSRSGAGDGILRRRRKRDR